MRAALNPAWQNPTWWYPDSPTKQWVRCKWTCNVSGQFSLFSAFFDWQNDDCSVWKQCYFVSNLAILPTVFSKRQNEPSLWPFSLEDYSQSRRLLSYQPFPKNCWLEHPPKAVPANSSHWQPMDTFLLHRNCTSQNHGTAGNCKANSFVNSAVRDRKIHRKWGSFCKDLCGFVWKSELTAWAFDMSDDFLKLAMPLSWVHVHLKNRDKNKLIRHLSLQS